VVLSVVVAEEEEVEEEAVVVVVVVVMEVEAVTEVEMAKMLSFGHQQVPIILLFTTFLSTAPPVCGETELRAFGLPKDAL
jgi:hypothetical protein